MRVTTSMLSETTVQAGLSMAGNSLVNYLDGDETDSLAKSLGNKHSTTSNVFTQKNYEKLKTAAEKLMQNADKLNTEGKNSLYEKARQDGDGTAVYDEVEKLVSSYNDMLDRITADTSTLGRFYQQSLKEAVKENKTGLSAIGISIDKNGRMSVNRDKLKAADVGSVESIFGTAGTLSSKLSMIAEKAGENAQANIRSASSQYNSSGNSVDALLRSYDAKR